MPVDRRAFRNELQRSRSNIQIEDEDKEASLQFGEREVRKGKLLFKGGFSFVYSASDKRGGESYVIRQVSLKDKSARQRAKDEIELLAQLVHHPHVVYSYGGKTLKRSGAAGLSTSYGKAVYLLEPFSCNLRARLEQQGGNFASAACRCPCLSNDEVMRVLDAGAQAFAYLHGLKITHYNAVCENMFLGSDELWKLGDFSCASKRVFELDRDPKLAREAAAFFQDRCAWPPEIADMDRRRPIGPTADIFMFGCMLFATLTGSAVIQFDSASRRTQLHMPAEAYNAYSPSILNWIPRCLAREPRCRPSATDLKREVERFVLLGEQPPQIPADTFAKSLDKLGEAIAGRRYQEIAELVYDAEGLARHFSRANHIPNIAALLEEKAAFSGELRRMVLEDYDTLHEPVQAAGADTLFYCVAAMEDCVREEVISRFCVRFLNGYAAMFPPSGQLSGLENWDRRYSWLKVKLREYEQKYSAFFMPGWRVPCALCDLFCRVTREHVQDLLNASTVPTASSQQLFAPMSQSTSLAMVVDPDGLVNALTKTIEFENNLSNKYSSGGDGRKVDFNGRISGEFDAHMAPWVGREEKRLLEAMQTSMAPGEENILERIDPVFLYSSADQLFIRLKNSVVTCSSFSTREPLLDLFQALRRVFARYIELVAGRMPILRAKPLARKALQDLCCVVGTAEYCDYMASKLEESVLQLIDPAVADWVTICRERDLALDVMTNGIKLIVASVRLSLDDAFHRMSLSNWAQFSGEAVRSSAFVNDISGAMHQQFTEVAKHLSKDHFNYFCDKFAQAFVVKLTEEIFACCKIGQQGACQLLLDCSFLQAALLEAPTTCTGRQMQTGYSKYVLREFGKIERMLCILTMPDVDASALAELFGGRGAFESVEDIDRLLRLRVDNVSPGVDELKRRMRNLGYNMNQVVFQKQEEIHSQITNFADVLKEKHAHTSEELKRMHAAIKVKILAFKFPNFDTSSNGICGAPDLAVQDDDFCA